MKCFNPQITSCINSQTGYRGFLFRVIGYSTAKDCCKLSGIRYASGKLIISLIESSATAVTCINESNEIVDASKSCSSTFIPYEEQRRLVTLALNSRWSQSNPFHLDLSKFSSCDILCSGGFVPNFNSKNFISLLFSILYSFHSNLNQENQSSVDLNFSAQVISLIVTYSAINCV